MSAAGPPSLRFLIGHPAHFIACGCGSGLARHAPGTAGTLFAWLCYPLLRFVLPGDAGFALALLIMFLIGISACDITGRHLGVADHGSIVWDEMVPFWTVLMLTPPAIGWQLAAFLLFRLFDITKPPPARFFDRALHNGLGVMMDDVVAAAYALLALAMMKSLLERMS